MKKQINPTIKAHLIRGAFYLLLLLAVCAIPFALGQRNAKKSAAKPNVAAGLKMAQAAPPSTGAVSAPSRKAPITSKAQLPNDVMAIPAPPSQYPMATGSATSLRPVRVLRMPNLPRVVLYDQYDNASANATNSQQFEAAFSTFDDFTADDFVVPAGETWNVESIDADGIPFNCSGSCIPDNFNVFFYTDSAGLPGTQVYSATGQPFAQVGSTYSITLTVPASLTAGTYWVSVQAREDFTGNGQWG